MKAENDSSQGVVTIRCPECGETFEVKGSLMKSTRNVRVTCKCGATVTKHAGGITSSYMNTTGGKD